MSKDENKQSLNDSIKIDFLNCNAGIVSCEHGITQLEEASIQKKCETVHQSIQADMQNIGFAKLPYDQQSADAILELANQHKGKWENIIVFGIGGSALGSIMLFNALCHPFHNEVLKIDRNNLPRFYVFDNIDPESLDGIKHIIRKETSLIILITKSGGTIETWGNYFQFLEIFGNELSPDQVIAVTDPKRGYLHQVACENRWQILSIPEDVGGRFSVLTSVGLFPAALLDIDIYSILHGAKSIDKCCKSGDIHSNPALKLAAFSCFLSDTKGKSISVLMPYSNALYTFADWFRQLWAESLGKRFDLSGKEVRSGQTPTKALGATDQHSQIQLYQEGPNDKLITFLKVNCFRAKGSFSGIDANSPFKTLSKISAEELINIELDSTREALSENQRPNILIEIPRISPFIMGQLIYLYELATCYAGQYWKINTFDQPGVESGKIRAKEKIERLYISRSSTI